MVFKKVSKILSISSKLLFKSKSNLNLIKEISFSKKIQLLNPKEKNLFNTDVLLYEVKSLNINLVKNEKIIYKKDLDSLINLLNQNKVIEKQSKDFYLPNDFEL